MRQLSKLINHSSCAGLDAVCRAAVDAVMRADVRRSVSAAVLSGCVPNGSAVVLTVVAIVIIVTSCSVVVGSGKPLLSAAVRPQPENAAQNRTAGAAGQHRGCASFVPPYRQFAMPERVMLLTRSLCKKPNRTSSGIRIRMAMALRVMLVPSISAFSPTRI